MKIYCLMFPGVWEEVVARGTACANRQDAETLLSDRIANGHAFPGEYWALIPCTQYVELTGEAVGAAKARLK